MDKDGKKTLYSAIKPTGIVTLGNYLGALKNFVKLQNEYNCIYCIADMHALTIRIEPAELRQNSLNLLALYMACGLDPEKSIIYYQSHVPAHAELSWVLSCYTMCGELSRMTQFKDKSSKNAENVNAGLYTYPSLMAADILLYQTDIVPIGEDQKQHLELTRDIANRFNSVYGDVFVLPEAYLPKSGARIKSLQDPTKKMAKSDDNPNSYIAMLDRPDDIRRKFRRAVTDSETVVEYRAGKDGINNLMTIYSVITGKSFDEIKAEFDGRGYGEFKAAVGEAVVCELAPIQDKFNYLIKNKDYLESIYTAGAEKAAALASRTLRKVYKKVGLVPSVRR